MSFRRIVIRSAIALSLLVGVPSAGFALYSNAQEQKASDDMGRLMGKLMDVKARRTSSQIEMLQWGLTSANSRYEQHSRATSIASGIAWATIPGTWVLALVLLWIARPSRRAGEAT